jgi:hypothetical protein
MLGKVTEKMHSLINLSMPAFQPIAGASRLRYSGHCAARKYSCSNNTGGLILDSKGLRALSGASLLVALLQSACTAVLTISGIRVAIGLSALAAASGIYAPARGFHQDAIRIPMLALAAAGAIVNLLVLAWIWKLRAAPAAQWRKREIGPKQRRSELLQVALAIVTLILVGLEVWTHPMVHRSGPAPAAHTSDHSFLTISFSNSVSSRA